MGLFFLNQLMVYSFSKALRRFEDAVDKYVEDQAERGLTVEDFLHGSDREHI